jgi:serine/threonine protein kinase
MTSGDDTTGLVREVYREALKRDPEEWSEFLDRSCAERADVRERVEILLGIRDAVPSDEVATMSPPSAPAAATSTLEGTTIGPYIIRRELGRGGMGVVYLADDTRLSRAVALKAIAPALGAELAGRKRLQLEARAAGGLSHPSIATVYALDEIDGVLYLACEYVPGEPLRALLKGGPLAIEQVVDIALQLARALATAHTQGIVHRDIKPENVMRTPSGVIKVLDFGLARLESSSQSGLTQTGAIVGTPAYLSPEQAQGQTADFRTDIFALGVLTYELASGKNPFATPVLAATLARIVNDDPAPLSELQPKSPPALDAFLVRCLRKDPRERYASTQEVVADLERLQGDLQDLRRSGSDAWRPRSAPPRSRWWWEVHQLAVTAMYAGMLYPSWYVQRFLPRTWGTPLLLAVLAVVAAGICLRLHLWFVSRSFPGEVQAQQAVTRPRLLLCDVAFGVLLVACGLAIGPEHPEFSMLFVGVAAATLVASFVIEPATARVAFGDRPAGTP